MGRETRGQQLARLRQQVRERDGPWCFYCGRLMPDGATLDHLVERSSGGRYVLSNVVLAHQRCNENVRGLTIEEKRHHNALLRIAYA